MTADRVTITALEPQKRRQERFNVLVDGEFWAGVSAEVVMKFRLKAGIQVARSFLSDVVMAEERLRARTRALRYIERMMRSEAEVRQKLTESGFDTTLIEETVSWLRERGFVSDRDLAESLLRSYREGRGAGPRMIAEKLRQKRIDPVIAGQVLEEAYAEADLAKEALALAESRMRRIQETDRRRKAQKLLQFLMRRGYPYEVAREAVEKAMRVE